jgi:hypothetical protein
MMTEQYGQRKISYYELIFEHSDEKFFEFSSAIHLEKNGIAMLGTLILVFMNHVLKTFLFLFVIVERICERINSTNK